MVNSKTSGYELHKVPRKNKSMTADRPFSPSHSQWRHDRLRLPHKSSEEDSNSKERDEDDMISGACRQQ